MLLYCQSVQSVCVPVHAFFSPVVGPCKLDWSQWWTTPKWITFQCRVKSIMYGNMVESVVFHVPIHCLQDSEYLCAWSIEWIEEKRGACEFNMEFILLVNLFAWQTWICLGWSTLPTIDYPEHINITNSCSLPNWLHLYVYAEAEQSKAKSFRWPTSKLQQHDGQF